MPWGVALAWGVLLVLAVVGPASGGPAPGGPAMEGKALYESRCAACHGASGDGKGPAAYLTIPRPRDFTSGVYKLRSTPAGSLPTDDDIVATIERGVPHTAMPGWADELGPSQIRSLVGVLKSFSARFGKDKAQPPLAIPRAPEATPSLVARGREVYAKAQCQACHGEKGTGDGPQSKTLRDESGMRARAADLTRPATFKGGATLQDLFKILTTGMDGTPMPSYVEALTVEERWELSAYVLSLAREPAAEPPASGPVEALAVRGDVPEEPTDTAWAQAAARAVDLRPLQAPRAGSTRLEVRAIASPGDVALLLSWKDATADADVAGDARFRDGVAVQFPARPQAGRTPPLFTMGSAEDPVYILHWKADFQAAATARQEAAAAPVVDTYYGLEDDRTFLTGTGAGNPLSAKTPAWAVEELNAIGIGSLTSQPAVGQAARGSGVHVDGGWRVVIRRSRRAGSGLDTPLVGKAELPVSFAVWNGSLGDRNGQKLVSTWQVLRLP